MRKCTCGCTVFDCVIEKSEIEDGRIDFSSDGPPRYWKKRGGRIEKGVKNGYYSPYICTKCGKKYEEYWEIPFWGKDLRTGRIINGEPYC